MRIKKIFLLLIGVLILSGCTKVSDLSYNDAVNYISFDKNVPNTYKKGFQFYVPSTLSVVKAGTNYVIMSDAYTNYYMYVDLLNYINKKELSYDGLDGDIYYSKIKYNEKKGYITIKSQKNNQYLIEIIYNYAKIEVMVDKDIVNRTIINAVNVLSSVKYNDDVILELLNKDKLNYTEEDFDFFEGIEESNTTNYLDYEDNNNEDENNDDITDTDFIN